MSFDDMDEIIGEFIVESYEGLDQLEQAFVSLEQADDPDTLARIFRTVHTIKGTSGFLGFSTLESVTHVGENLLSKLRDGELPMTTEIADGLLAMIDAVRQILSAIADSGAEDDTCYDDLVATLVRLDSAEAALAPVHPIPRRRNDTAAAAAGIAVEPEPETYQPIGQQLLEAGAIGKQQLNEALAAQRQGDPRHIGELLVAHEALSPADVAAALARQSGQERHGASETIRVDVSLLDDLMNSVGELVLARNQILRYTETQQDSAFIATSQRLDLITSELQENVMKTRMQPIENVWNKFPRVVRDLTVSCGKSARLDMVGRHTELDKTLLEAIRDPLTHLVRNSVDHGLETIGVRLAAGKPAEGVVTLTARHEGGQVMVEISDDGAGIDPAVIRRKAIEKGILSSEEAAQRSDRDIISLIFRPGFSTAASVTNISGRGVGMDVVRTNIEGIGGSVDVQSTVGTGTTFTVKIPLTLAIIPALIVTSGDGRYAIPQVSLIELVRVRCDDVEQIDGQRVYRLRGTLLPLIDLNETFGAHRSGDHPDSLNIVVVRADERVFGLVVDDINDTAEIVVKPLGRLLQHATWFAGATIMGDGRVALIIDALGFAEHVGLDRDAEQRGRSGARTTSAEAAEIVATERMLVARVGSRRFAMPLDIVARLEQFAADKIEIANNRSAVQYGSEIMPLVRLGDELGVDHDLDATMLPAIVFNVAGRSVGLLVDQIVDIVEEAFDVTTDDHMSHGVLGSSVINGLVTDLVDIHGVLSSVLPALVRDGAAA